MASPSSTAKVGVFEDFGFSSMSSSSSSDTVDLESAAPAVADNHVNPVDSNPHKTESSTLMVDNPRREQSSERAVHVHRVNHNSSKLPAFRFADRPRDSLGLFPGLPLLSGLLQSDTTNSYSNSDGGGISNTNNKPQHHPSLLVSSSVSSSLDPGPGPGADDSPSFCTSATRPRIRRADITPKSKKPTSLARRDSQGAHSSKTTTNECAQGQPGLDLAEVVNGELPYDDDKTERRESTSRRPVSYRPPSSSISGRTAIPPIRSFRSSGSRKSPKSDMNNSASRSYGDGDDEHSIHRSRSLRALEGRRSSDWSTFPPTSGDGETLETIESDNTAEIFMNIAREDSSSNSRRKPDARGDENQNGPVSRVVRSARQRPFSTAIPSLQNPTSPVQVSRRLSDLTASRTRRTAEDQTSQYPNREVLYRSSTIDRPSLSFDATRARSTVSSLRPSPITPRTSGAHDTSAEGSSIFARRPATSEHTRTAHRQSTGLSKSFNSSPRAPKTSESHHAAGAHHEASESSNSTAAPSTVWDELDELKSRIHRLELTGKMPRTSGAAMSRVSDERPPTAGTGATTLSGSPKRVSGAGAAQTEILSTTSSLRESQPILKSALSKTKSFVSPDIYDAIEAAANDAMSLSQMMGAVGQPGPISSGASTIGAGGSTTVTDRQLRKKTDSICRSLTELCLALTDEGSRRKTAAQKSQPEPREMAKQNKQELPSSPPPMKVFSGAPRRETANADEPVPRTVLGHISIASKALDHI
ncbi:hypothetical protein VP1G_06822 [Cytospora mali]|uniref:Uncharacterized protein n=1 Tax=Cytospora mali TaxID=578113 RepID=A0A194V6P9_CYTMA|nr:hypothetical protein VP1G_06822 [Valsa mali var. pyri (nom. inval.)]